MTEIGGGAFSMCKFESLDIPNSVTNIGWAAFQNCISLTSISIPSSITTLSSQLFDGCTALTTITIPNSVTIIGSLAFYNCTNLKSIIIPNNVTTIESEAFRDCSSLNTITIPNSVKTIGENAFLNTGLASVTIGSGVTDIRAIAFKNCDELKDVYCLAEKISKDNSWNHEGLFTYPDAFQDSYPQYMTLHVPAASIEAYRSTEPWSNFNAIVPLEDGEIPVIQKCATPEISYENGKVKFTCETEGVDFISEVTVDDAKKYYDSEFTLSQTYKISVYATKAGYENSDVATREIVIENGQSSLFGDLNKDGKVNVADHVKLSDIIMNK